jgi:hypothetical protein
MLELKLYLYPRYWTWLPTTIESEVNNMQMRDFVWLCFGIGWHNPTD